LFEVAKGKNAQVGVDAQLNKMKGRLGRAVTDKDLERKRLGDFILRLRELNLGDCP
jgi:hypothetical protein